MANINIPTSNATTTATGKIQLAGDLSGTATSPTVPGLVNAQVSTLTTTGHSWAASGETSAYGFGNFGTTGLLGRFLGLLGIHENNHTHLAVGAAYLCRTTSAFGAANSGWAGVARFVIPYNHPLMADTTVLNYTNFPEPQPSSFLFVHHINDISIIGTGLTTAGLAIITTAFMNALRFCISRARAGNLYTSYYDSSAAIAWDTTVITGTSGFSATASTGTNTGVAVYRSTTNTNTITLTIPSTYSRNGVFAVAFLSNYQTQTTTSTVMNSSDVTTAIVVVASTDFRVNDIIQMYSGGVASNELMQITVITNTTNITVSRGFNSTTKTTHASGDELFIRNDATLTVTGTAANATGTLDVSSSNSLPSQARSGGRQKTPTVKRFILTAADAGKTFIFTVGSIMTGATNTEVDFDSAWIESYDPQPVVVCNAPIYGLSGGYSTPTYAQYIAWNTSMAAICAEFIDGAVRIGDIATPMGKMSATLNANITSAAGISATVTAIDSATFATFGDNTTFCVEGERLRPSSITNNNDGTFTLNSLTRAEDGTTAASHVAGKTISEGSWMSNDAIHANAFGCAAMAAIFYEALKTCTETSAYTLAFAGGNSSQDNRANNLGLYNNSYLTLPTNVQTNNAGIVGTMYAHPIYIPQVCVVNLIGTVVTTLNASSTLRFGIYGPDLSRSRPQYLLKEFGTVGGTTTGFRSVTTNHILRPGWYFLVVSDQGTVCTKRCIGASGLNLPYLSTLSAPGTAYAPVNAYSITGITGALPATWGSWSEETTARCPLIFIRVGSVHKG